MLWSGEVGWFFLPDKRGEIDWVKTKKGENFWLHMWLRVMQLKTLQFLVHLLYYYRHYDYYSKANCTYDVHKFKYSRWKKFFPCFVIALVQYENLFLATVFEFLYVITALCFNSSNFCPLSTYVLLISDVFKIWGDEKMIFFRRKKSFSPLLKINYQR